MILAGIDVPERTPSTRSLLPFRAESGTCRGFPVTTLFYTAEAAFPDRSLRKVEMTQSAETPIGVAILALMRMYFDLESTIDGVAKDREELQIRVGQLEAQLRGDKLSERGKNSRDLGLVRKKERENGG